MAGVDECPFCLISEGVIPAEIVRSWKHVLAFVPLHPVALGHVLVIPRRHVVDAAEDHEVTGLVFSHAAELIAGSANLITSVGAAATQTVNHLHVHVVPRQAGDGFALPWTSRLTEDEHEAVRAAGCLANRVRRIIGDGPTAESDWAEAAQAIHIIQNMVLAQAGARAYPDNYRLLGQSLARVQ